MAEAYLEGGLQNPAVDSAHAFRVVLNAMAQPGTIHELAVGAGPEPLSRAAASIMLVLCDNTTPIYLVGSHKNPAIEAWLRFHCGAVLTDQASEADFIVGSWPALQPLDRFKIGSELYPDRSASLIVEMPTVSNTGAILSGPGIETTQTFSLPEISVFKRNHALYPLGIDFYFTAGSDLAAVPRSTNIEEN